MSYKHDPEYLTPLLSKVHTEYAVSIDAGGEGAAKSLRFWFYGHRKVLLARHIHIYDKVSAMLAGSKVIFYHTQLGYDKAVRLAEGTRP